MDKIFTRREYLEHTKGKISGKKDCFFCNSQKIQDLIVETTACWNIVMNNYPYSGDTKHLIVAPKRHIVFSHELEENEWADLKSVYSFMREFYLRDKEENYFSATRETMGERSVEHYHIHFIPGKLETRFLTSMLQQQGYPVEGE